MARRGRHPLNELSAARVRTIKKPGMYADGNGLYLRVDPSGARRWVQRLTVRGKRHNLGLGGWPVVSLLEAREKAITNRRIAKAGGDPLLLRRKLDMPTFAEAAERVMAFRRPTWRSDRHATQWASTLRTYVYPTLGPLLVDEITTADVLSVLTPIWTSKAETGKRVRQRVGTVMDWAIAQGLRTDNPAAAISAALPKTHKTKAHLAALPYLEVPGAVQSIRECAAGQVSKLSFEYLALTAARTGEVRHAHWGEIDWASRTWTIPAARMKAGKEHRVPLSNRALEVLWDVKALSDGTGLIFPGRGGKPLSKMTHLQILRRLGIKAVPHGFRSSFRDWAAEITDTPHAVMEAALAHVVPSATEAAYARSDLFDRRRKLMDQWAEYLSDAG